MFLQSLSIVGQFFFGTNVHNEAAFLFYDSAIVFFSKHCNTLRLSKNKQSELEGTSRRMFSYIVY